MTFAGLPLTQARTAHLAVRWTARGLMLALPVALVAVSWGWAPAAWSQASAKPAPTVAAKPTPSTTSKESRPTWQQLTAEQREALAPLAAEWRTIDATRKQTWLQLAARMPDMSSDERDRIQQRMAEWVAMSPKERGQARIQFQEARRLAPSGRQEHWEAYQALPQEQRRALAAQAAAAPRRVTPNATVKAAEAAPLLSPSIKPTTQSKRNIVNLPSSTASLRLVAPTVVQSRQGATTSLMTTPAKPPAFHQAGLPKVNAGAGFVDPATLLPRRGPQGAAATPPTLPADSSVPATVDD